LVLAVLLVLGAGIILWRFPLAALAMAGRVALRVQGFRELSVSGPNGSISYFRAGSGAPIVFIHGANDQAGTWARVAPAFASAYKVVVVDLAGHGDSAPATGPLPGDALFAGLDSVMDAEAREPATLIGNSLGGWMALVYALNHPDRVVRVVSINGAISRGESQEASTVLSPTTREEARRTVSRLFSPASGLYVPDFVLDDLVRRSPTSPVTRLMAAPPASLERFLIDDRLADLRVPVFVFWGEDDGLLSLSYARQATARIPDARLEVLPTCGHMPQRECPRALLDELRAIVQ
ncbi:MAG: alpha/beta fold hydrolase, partial [Vicinamibacterales bacterium]